MPDTLVSFWNSKNYKTFDDDMYVYSVQKQNL